MIPLYHRGGPVPCGMPAIGVRKLGSRYSTAAENVVLLDGRTPKRGDPMICGACRQPIVTQWLFPSPDRQVRALAIG